MVMRVDEGRQDQMTRQIELAMTAAEVQVSSLAGAPPVAILLAPVMTAGVMNGCQSRGALTRQPRKSPELRRQRQVGRFFPAASKMARSVRRSGPPVTQSILIRGSLRRSCEWEKWSIFVDLARRERIGSSRRVGGRDGSR